MKIVMLSDMEASGGAAIAASRLAAALVRSGQDVTRIVGWPHDEAHAWKTEMLHLENSLTWRVAKRMLPEGLFEKKRSTHLENRLHELLTELKPDCINIHNLHSSFRQGWRVELVRVCRQHARTVWTLHDMWSFTGRCSYSYDCEKFLAGCDHFCPTPHEYPELSPEKIHGAWLQRKRLFKRDGDLIAVTPSKWLADQAKRGLWKRHSVEVIPNGLPLNVFRPVDRAEARQKLGIRNDIPVLLLVSQTLSERRKGTNILVEALRQITFPLTLLTMGGSPPEFENSHVTHIPLGFVEEDETKVRAYNAATLLVHAALADNQPNVIVESIACGTPVLAFPVGGVTEIVRPDRTGWLAPEISPAGLRSAIQSALSSAGDLLQSCRAVAEDEFSDEIQAQKYLRIMNDGL